jgi:uncharacterized membrane protein
MEFVEKYFIEPTVRQSGYNVVNTVVYGLTFILLLYVAIKFFERSKIKLNEKVWFELLPFVFLGGILRSLFDLNFFSAIGFFQYFFITPLLYLTIFLIILVCTFISRVYPKFLNYSGIVLAVSFGLIVLWYGKNVQLFLTALFFSSIVYIILIALLKVVKLHRLAKGINSHVLYGHLLDACSATVAVSLLGYRESQILSAHLIMLSPLTFILIKALVPLVLLYFINRRTKGNTNFILKFALLILGLPQGVHNSLLLLSS